MPAPDGKTLCGAHIRATTADTTAGVGGTVQAVVRPDGLPIWTSAVTEGHTHDLTAARNGSVLGALDWAVSRLRLPTLAEAATRAPVGVSTPRSGNPATGRPSAPTTRPTTRCCAAPAPAANAASPCWSDAGERSSTSPLAPAESPTSSKLHSCSPNSSIATYAFFAEIT
ncbi:hypothetical protein [Pseudonocardia asaccharolytica]|uniref:Uncharacterized protein n=1 Tax=Pseudonocardia asaccharolytica DSM 44247 = NBRC 16224 TaxID=1123024 RepID=A0A511D6Z0_9PSEU|nr:hypothetical protein [Pseudonocardia asaccharolytica]GEL20213.1 hypothetical protein PA7_40500 [Pseudonocardia asaccharolytica DSM 44247 = NBRC 16224]